MTPRYVSIPATTRLREVVDRHILGSGSGSFMVRTRPWAI